MNLSPRILIVVVNYQTPALTMTCVESLAPSLQQYPGAEVVVVDNGSGDGSAESFSTQLRTCGPLAPVRDRVRLFCLPQNGGFAVGNNAAVRAALASDSPPDHVWLLNSDTAVHPFALEALVAAMESNPRLGIAGSRMENPDGSPQHSAFRFPTIAGEWEANIQWASMTRILERSVMAPPTPTADTRVDWVPGASMFIRRAVLEQIGLLDESFFMYFEDVDYCRRAAVAGWETWYIPASRVAHHISATSIITSMRRAEQRRPRYWFEARQHYFVRHHGFLYTLCANGMWLLGVGLRRVREIFRGKPNTDPPHFWRDFFLYSIGQKGRADE